MDAARSNSWALLTTRSKKLWQKTEEKNRKKEEKRRKKGKNRKKGRRGKREKSGKKEKKRKKEKKGGKRTKGKMRKKYVQNYVTKFKIYDKNDIFQTLKIHKKIKIIEIHFIFYKQLIFYNLHNFEKKMYLQKLENNEHSVQHLFQVRQSKCT